MVLHALIGKVVKSIKLIASFIIKFFHRDLLES